MREETVLNFYKKSLQLHGICPFGVKNLKKYSSVPKIYVCLIFCMLVSLIIYIGSRTILLEKSAFTVLEHIFNIGEIFIFLSVIISIFYGSIGKRTQWKLFYTNMNNFDKQVHGIMMFRSIKFGRYLQKEKGIDNLNKVIRRSNDVFLNVKNSNNHTSKNNSKYINNSRNTPCCILKFLSLHLIMPLFGVFEIKISWMIDFLSYDIPKFLAHYCGLHYYILLSAFLWEISIKFKQNYNHLEDLIRLTFENEALFLSNDLKKYICDIKTLYKYLYLSSRCLENILGITILLMFVDIIMRFLINFFFSVLISKDSGSLIIVGGMVIRGFLFLVSSK